MNKQKTYKDLREEQELNEINLLRAGAALVFANKVKEYGKSLERNVSQTQSALVSAKGKKNTEDKLDAVSNALIHLSNALKDSRFMMGNLAGIGISVALTSSRTQKEIIKLTKQKQRRR